MKLEFIDTKIKYEANFIRQIKILAHTCILYLIQALQNIILCTSNITNYNNIKNACNIFNYILCSSELLYTNRKYFLLQ